MSIRTYTHPTTGLIQRLAVADLTQGGDLVFARLVAEAPEPVAVVYSDPPWNPGNEKYWRRFAGVGVPESYDRLLDAWCECAAACGVEHIFCEQSANAAHRQLLFDAVDRCSIWGLPLIEQWTVCYGSPLRPNVLLHWGQARLATDPSGLHGESMTRRVFDGLPGLRGQIVADPCMGLGMTSRMAHVFGAHCIGTEMNADRLGRTIGWLLRHGYEERP